MKNFIVRTLTGILFVGLVAGSLLLHPYAYALVFAAIVVLGMREFFMLMNLGGMKPQKWTGIVTGLTLFVTSFLHASHQAGLRIYLLIFLLGAVVYIIELFLSRDMPFQQIAVTMLGVLYIALPLSLFNYLVFPFGQMAYDPRLVLGFFFLIWSCDTGAYITGSTIGKHHLWPSISPKKTWEGVFGGLVLAFIVGWILSVYFTELSMIQWFVSAFIVTIAGTFGDLSESALKRSLGLKDSGTLFPGHGGVLDRFDSTFLAAPLFFAWIAIIL